MMTTTIIIIIIGDGARQRSRSLRAQWGALSITTTSRRRRRVPRHRLLASACDRLASLRASLAAVEPMHCTRTALKLAAHITTTTLSSAPHTLTNCIDTKLAANKDADVDDATACCLASPALTSLCLSVCLLVCLSVCVRASDT